MVLARQGIWKGNANRSCAHSGRPRGPANSLPLFNKYLKGTRIECSHFRASRNHCQLGRKADDGQECSACSPRRPITGQDCLPPSTNSFRGGMATVDLHIHGLGGVSQGRERSGRSVEQERQEDGALKSFQDDGYGRRVLLHLWSTPVLLVVPTAAHLYASSESWETTPILGGRGRRVRSLRPGLAPKPRRQLQDGAF